jgi:hypothetical protein
LRPQWNRHIKRYGDNFLLERSSSFWRLYQRVGNLTRTISSKKFYRHFLDRKGQITERNLTLIVLSIWTNYCAMMLEQSIWNWNIQGVQVTP